MSAFADSSALVKLYVSERGHDVVRDLPRPLVVATLARVEVPAALWGKVRVGELAPRDAAILVSAFEFDYHGDSVGGPAFAAVPVGEELLVSAARLSALHNLRAYDAVQLACAKAARSVDESVHTFAAFDRRLCEAALVEGFTLVGTF